MGKPLAGRTNIVITRKDDFSPGSSRVKVAKDTEEALQHAADTDAKESFVIGGGEVYRLYMDRADRIYLTRVHAVLDGDVFFPEIDTNKWMLVDSTHFDTDNRHAYPYTFETWHRKPGNS